MSAKKKPIQKSWVDPDDAPTLTLELARRGQISVDGNVVRDATGTVTKRGRPPVGERPKQQVTMRLAPEVLSAMRNTGPGWQVRAEDALRRAFVESDLDRAHAKALNLRKEITTSLAKMAAQANRRASQALIAKKSDHGSNRSAGGKGDGRRNRQPKKSA